MPVSDQPVASVDPKPTQVVLTLDAAGGCGPSLLKLEAYSTEPSDGDSVIKQPGYA